MTADQLLHKIRELITRRDTDTEITTLIDDHFAAQAKPKGLSLTLSSSRWEGKDIRLVNVLVRNLPEFEAGIANQIARGKAFVLPQDAGYLIDGWGFLIPVGEDWWFFYTYEPEHLGRQGATWVMRGHETVTIFNELDHTITINHTR